MQCRLAVTNWFMYTTQIETFNEPLKFCLKEEHSIIEAVCNIKNTMRAAVSRRFVSLTEEEITG